MNVNINMAIREIAKFQTNHKVADRDVAWSSSSVVRHWWWLKKKFFGGRLVLVK